MFTAQKCVLGSSPDSAPPHFVRVFKSVMSPIMLFKSELGHTRTLVVDFGDQITRIYQSRYGVQAHPRSSLVTCNLHVSRLAGWRLVDHLENLFSVRILQEPVAPGQPVIPAQRL